MCKDVPCENRRYATARTGGDVTQLGVLEGATGEQDEEAEEMDEMFQTPSETLTGYRLVLYTFFLGWLRGKKGSGSEIFVPQEP